MWGDVSEEDVRIRMKQIINKKEEEEITIVMNWVLHGIDCVHIYFLPCHFIEHSAHCGVHLHRLLRFKSIKKAS